MNIILKEKNNFFAIFLVLFLPIALITGPFLSDLCIILLSIILLFKIRNESIKTYNLEYLFFFLIVAVYFIISSILSDFKYHSLQSSLFYFRFIIFAYAFAFILLKINNLPKYLYLTILIILLFISLDAIYQYFFGINFFGFENKYPWTTQYGNGAYHRVSGVFKDELKLGSYISKFIPILVSLYFFLKINKKFDKFLFFFVLIISILTILITGERAAFAYVIFFSIIGFLLFDINKKIKIIFIFIAFLLSSSFIYFDKTLKMRFDSIFNSINSPGYIYKNFDKIEDDIPLDISIFTNQHARHYITAFRLFLDHPLTGIGPKNFRKLCDEDKYRIEYACSTHPHNTYIQLLSETGLVGFLLIFLLFIYQSYILLMYFFKKYVLNKLYANSIISINIGIFINLWPITPTGSFYSNWNSIIFYLPFGVLLFLKFYEKFNKQL
tara:strand:- start:6285 stop:7604 length:1320 start_codon:yes stop_codon:yes gene_type:complete